MGNYGSKTSNDESNDEIIGKIHFQKKVEENSALFNDNIGLMKSFIEKISTLEYIGQSEKYTETFEYYDTVINTQVLIYSDNNYYFLFVCDFDFVTFNKVIIRIKKNLFNYKIDEPIIKIFKKMDTLLYLKRILHGNLDDSKIELYLKFSEQSVKMDYDKYDFNEYLMYKESPEQYDFDNDSFNHNIKLFLNQI